MTATKISIDQAIAALEEYGINENEIGAIKRAIRLKEIEPICEQYKKENDLRAYAYPGIDYDSGEVVIRHHRYCGSNTDAKRMMEIDGITEIPELKKQGYCDQKGDPKTSCEYTCWKEYKGVKVKITYSYTREGLPTNSCRVVPSISYSVACDLTVAQD